MATRLARLVSSFFSHIYNYSAHAPIDLYAEPVATLLKPKPKKRLRNRIEIVLNSGKKKNTHRNRTKLRSILKPRVSAQCESTCTANTNVFTCLPNTRNTSWVHSAAKSSQAMRCGLGQFQSQSQSQFRTLLGKTGLELIVIVQFDFAILIVTTFYN